MEQGEGDTDLRMMIRVGVQAPGQLLDVVGTWGIARDDCVELYE